MRHESGEDEGAVAGRDGVSSTDWAICADCTGQAALVRRRMILLACPTSTIWPFSLSCSCWASTSLNFALDASSANALFCCFKVRTCSKNMQQAADQRFMPACALQTCTAAVLIFSAYIHAPGSLVHYILPCPKFHSYVMQAAAEESAELCMPSSKRQTKTAVICQQDSKQS